MKNIAIAVLAAFLVRAIAYAQSPMQIMMPRNAYTGDRCELRYVFSTDAELIHDGSSSDRLDSVELDTASPVFRKEADKCMVYRAALEHIGREYTLTVYFIPWYPCDIDFGAFDIAFMARKAQKIDGAGEPFIIDLAPVAISSLSEKLGAKAAMPPSGPMIVPGTVFILASLAIVLLVAIAFAVFVIIKAPLLATYFVMAREQHRLKKLLGRTKRLLRKLLKANSDDDSFCQSLSSIIRDYLCGRFSSGFASLTTGEYVQKFDEICCGAIPNKVESVVMDIVEVMQRCDYVRFARGSLDSLRQPAALYEAALGEGESNLLVSRCIDAVSVLGTFTMEEGEKD